MPGVRLDNLMTQRVAAGLTRDELAKQANVSLWRLRQMEVSGGNCSGDEAQRIADALGTDLTTLGEAVL
jgi:hypothetical protein